MSFESHHFLDPDGRPAGGHSFGTGFSIAWQRGGIGPAGGGGANGAFLEDVVAAVADRLEHLTRGAPLGDLDHRALELLSMAITLLQRRTALLSGEAPDPPAPADWESEARTILRSEG